MQPRKPFYFGLVALLGYFFAAVPVTCLCGLHYWVMSAPAVPEHKLAQMRVGMTKAEVRGLLGEPSNEKGELWVYDRMTVGNAQC